MKNKITKYFPILCMGLRCYSFVGGGLYIAYKYILPPAMGRYEHICGLFPNEIICGFIFYFEESFILWLLYIPLMGLYFSIDDYISPKISEKIKKIKERRKQELNKKENN